MTRLESQATLHRFMASVVPESHRPKYEGRAVEAWLRWERGQRQVVAVDGEWVRWAS